MAENQRANVRRAAMALAPLLVDQQERLAARRPLPASAASALLARQLCADHLLLLTDVNGVYLDWDTPAVKLVARAGPTSLRADDFAPGSMRPKLEAAAGFVTETGRRASIGRLEDAVSILKGSAGTTIDVSFTGVSFR